MRKDRIPDYEILEYIDVIENPEMEAINKARNALFELVKDDLSETEIQTLKERRLL